MFRERSMSDPRLDFGLRMPSGLDDCADILRESVGSSSGDVALLLSDSTYEVSFSRTRRRASASWLANSSVSSSVAVLVRSNVLESEVRFD
jgi:hypothetical protein